jgi:hypothetical protein
MGITNFNCFQEPELAMKLVLLISSLLICSTYVIFGFQPASAIDDYNFAAAGDWGCTSNTDATLVNMNGKGPERVFGLGDYSYASTGSCFFSKIDASGLTGKTKIAIGNHEDDDSEGFSGYMSHFSQSQTYFSYNHGDVHILVVDTDRNSYASGSTQRNFVQNDLQSASTNPNIKWIIVYLHKPMYTSPNTCGSSSCSNTGSENTNIRNGFGPMFAQYGVDLVLQGHVHNYQRTYKLTYNQGNPASPTITDNNPNTYTEGNGAIYAIVGTGGVNFHALSGKAAFTSSQQDDFFGQLDIASTNDGNTLQGKFYRNGNNDVLDSFSITKAGNLPPTANNQVVTVNKNTDKSITLTATDPNNDPLAYSLVTQPAHGTITGTAPNLIYTPDAGYLGPDTFTFKTNDGIIDSNIATVSITVQDPGACTTNLAISGVTASGSESRNPPSNAIDNDLRTRWANSALGSWIRADLGSVQNICSVDIAWYKGNARQYHFIIATSTDGTTFTNVFSGDSSGTTASSEKYIIPATDARYVRVTINGNTQNNAASIYELDIFGSPSGNLPPVANNQAVAVNKNTAKSITLTATDPNNDLLTYSIVTPPEHGTLSGTGTSSDYIYNPDAGYLGPDTFTFKTNDGIIDSNIATVSITVQDPGACTTNLPISGATASGSESTHPPTHAIDNNFGTRWAADPDFGSWLRADLGSVQSICSVDIAWYNGNPRQYHFIIATSTDGTTFTNVFSGDSSGTTASSEKYMIPATDARYVRITINGNTESNAASIYELDIFGSSSSVTAYHFEPSLSLTGPD